MNTNSHGSPIPSESERKRREETGLANSVRGGGAPARSPVPERMDDDGRWRAAVAVDRECESESRWHSGGGMGIRDLGLGMEREAAGSGLYMRRGGLASWVVSLAGPNEAVGAPGRLFAPGRARAVPRAGVAAQAWPGASGRAVPVPCQNDGPRAGPAGRGLHGQIYINGSTRHHQNMGPHEFNITSVPLH